MPKPPPGFEWDDKKAAWNAAAHKVSFAAVKDFDFADALELEGSEHGSEEARTTLIGKIKRTCCVLVFARRAGNVRVISLRHATAKERRHYIEATGY